MQTLHPRIAREQKTIQKMAQLYCRDHHGAETGTLCADCAALEKYALERLHRCPFQEKKSTCAKCLVHCYHPVMREKVRKMMRYAGPRMLRRHPVLALLHLADGLRKAPSPPVRKKPGG
jgi:hypothetical protein